MKIIAIGRNYAAHIAELNHEQDAEPVVFLKPDTTLLRDNAPFYHPDFSDNIHHEVEIVLRVSKMGKCIDKQFAHKYYDHIALGIDFTARDLQSKLKEKGQPWEIAKAFDASAPVSAFVPITHYADLRNLNFSLHVNGEIRQKGNTKMMLFGFDHIVSYVSRFFTLKVGDLIFTGTPAGVGKVKVGDQVQGFIESEQFLDFQIK